MSLQSISMGGANYASYAQNAFLAAAFAGSESEQEDYIFPEFDGSLEAQLEELDII